MPGSDKNILIRAIEVQNITLSYTNIGVSQKWVYENIIYPRFFISRSTYYRYLAMPAKRELNKRKAALNETPTAKEL